MVVELPFRGPRVWPSLFDGNLGLESHAKPAAFEAAGGRRERPPDALGDFEGRFPSFVRKVVNMRPFLSGLGVLEACFAGTGSAGGGGGDEYVGVDIAGRV